MKQPGEQPPPREDKRLARPPPPARASAGLASVDAFPPRLQGLGPRRAQSRPRGQRRQPRHDGPGVVEDLRTAGLDVHGGRGARGALEATLARQPALLGNVRFALGSALFGKLRAAQCLTQVDTEARPTCSAVHLSANGTFPQ